MNCQDGYCGADDCRKCFPFRDYWRDPNQDETPEKDNDDE